MKKRNFVYINTKFLFFYFSLEILNLKGLFFIILPLTNGLKPLSFSISQKQSLAK